MLYTNMSSPCALATALPFFKTDSLSSILTYSTITGLQLESTVLLLQCPSQQALPLKALADTHVLGIYCLASIDSDSHPLCLGHCGEQPRGPTFLQSNACYSHLGKVNPNLKEIRLYYSLYGEGRLEKGKSYLFIHKTHTHAHTHTHTHIHTCLHTYAHTHTPLKTHTHTYLHTYAHTHTQLKTHTQNLICNFNAFPSFIPICTSA